MTDEHTQSGTADIAFPVPSGLDAYRLRLKRRRLLWRSFRARHQLQAVADRTSQIHPDDLLVVAVLRNEMNRLPYFLKYYRDLGVSRFLVVDNASDDGSAEYLAAEYDVSLWRTSQSYRDSRFGLDWLTWLQIRYCHGHWTLVVDADELLVYPGQDRHDLRDLTSWLDAKGRLGFGALMLDLYPKGPLDGHGYAPGQDPLDVLQWFDPAPYRSVRQRPMGNLWVQGGVRERMFFADEPQKSPTLNKIPLIKWNRRFAYVNSTHSALPPRLNAIYSGPGGGEASGALIHTKFLPEIVSKSAIEKQRGQHFARPAEFDSYYDSLTGAPDFWTTRSVRYEGPEQLAALGLLRGPDWAD